MRIDFPGVVGTIEVYLDVMRALCGNTKGKSMIDLMCAFAPNTPKLGFEKRTYIDFLDRKLDHASEQNNFFQGDVTQIFRFVRNVVLDVAICSDGIEHLLKDDGMQLLVDMRNLSKKQILFTPLGEIFKLAEIDNQDPESHRSLWTPEDIEKINSEDGFPITLGQPYACIVFPDYHKVWNGGAFFFWRDESGTIKDFDRVAAELKQKPWAK